MRKRAAGGVLLALGLVSGATVSAGAAVERCGGRRVTIFGTEQADRISGTRYADVISGFGGADVIEGLGGRDYLCGGDGNDRIIAGNGDDNVWGQRGHDTMQGGRGGDRLDGGGRADTASYKGADTPVDANLSISAAIGEGADALVDVERLIGSDHPDVLTGDDGRNLISGVGGADRIDGMGGRDVQRGGIGDDRIHGGDGHDVHYGGPGADFTDGGDGTDLQSFRFSSRAVTVDVAEGTATGEGSDTFGNMEIIEGSRRGDSLWGDDTANTFYPLGGNDAVDGRGGFDFVVFVQSLLAVTVDLGGGVASGNGDDSLTSIEGVVGTLFEDALTGDDGDNALYGLHGDDELDGRGGSDYLNGGPDTDTCTNGEDLDGCE